MRRTRGQVFAAPAPLVEHWDGRAWHRVALPRGLVKPGVPYYPATAAAGPRNLWVFGIDGQWLHWDGAWTTGTLPDATDLDASAMFGPRDVWAFGVLDPNTRPRPYAARVVTLPAPASRVHYHLTQLAADGAGGIRAIGPCANCQRIPSRLWHERAGQWSGPLVPSLARRRWILFGLAAARSMWGAGDVGSSGPSGLIALWAPARSFG